MPHRPKASPLDPYAQIAKALGAVRVCRTCTPFERERLAQTGPGPHPRCDDIDCGCACQNEAKRS